MFFSDATTDYINHIKHERKLAATTVEGYISWIRNYEAWLIKKGHLQPLTLETCFTTIILRQYQQDCSMRDLRPRSIRGIFFPLRGFGDFLVGSKVIPSNPVRDLKMPKLDAARRVVVSDEDLARLLDTCQRQRDPQRRAFDLALLSTLIYTGVRASECLDMRLADVDFNAKTIIIRAGKGSKSRVLYPAPECMEALQTWFAVRPKCKHDWVWAQNLGRRISVEALRGRIEDVKWLAGLEDAKHIQPHSIRHNFACRLMHAGGDLKTIQAALGHAHGVTTMLYLHYSEEPAKGMQTLAALPPVARNAPTPAPKSEGNKQAIQGKITMDKPSRAENLRARRSRFPSRVNGTG